ncbi:MAG TPA: BON domain-containing protein [Steroidobacteraceae bacterium]|nr:BON domain-containing protein [Steroidobacteraceae bacterium]
MSDSDIQRNVQNELQWEPSVDDREIGVRVSDGVVTLVGTVSHYADRYNAEQVAKRVAGVRAIANEIQVKVPKPGERSDSDVATAAANALKWNVAVGSCGIKAVVKQGWVTLSGEVAYGYQRGVAENLVRYLSGVTGVSNDVIVKPSVKMADVKGKIEAAFQRQAELDAKDIDITVDDGTITLKGWVHSWRERDDAARAAWGAPGVKKVDNQLQVQY